MMQDTSDDHPLLQLAIALDALFFFKIPWFFTKYAV